MGHVRRRRLYQPDVAIDAAARIPARRVRWIVEPDRNYIVRAVLHIRREIEFERCITIRPATDKLSV